MNKIKVFDIDALVAQEYPEYEPFRYKKAAIFEGPRGVVFSEEEAVHQKENALTDAVVVPLAKRTDKNHIAIFATAKMTVSLDEIVAKAPFEEMSMDEFFSRRNYNPRCQDNYETLMKSLRNIGFDLYGFFEDKPSIETQMKEAFETQKHVQKKPDCPLIGQDGNIFNLMAIASKTLRKNDMAEQAEEMCSKIRSSGSYDEALCTLGEYVNITSVDKSQSRESVLRESPEL